MTFKKFISKINWRQVIVHFIAFWFFSHAFLTFSRLHNIKLTEIARNSNGMISNATFIENKITGDDLVEFLWLKDLSPLVGLMASFIWALLISKKRHWFWVNSFLAFIAFCFLLSYDLLGWNFLGPLFWKPGKIFDNIVLEFLFNGFILLAAGLLFFYFRPVTDFIESEKRATT